MLSDWLTARVQVDRGEESPAVLGAAAPNWHWPTEEVLSLGVRAHSTVLLERGIPRLLGPQGLLTEWVLLETFNLATNCT